MNKIFLIFINQLNFLFSYLIIMFFASKLSVSDFGILTYLKNIIALSLIFIVFGLDRSSLHLFKDKPLLMYPYANMTKLIIYIIVLITLTILYSLSYIDIPLSLFLMILFLPIVFVFDIKYLFDIFNKIKYEIIFSYLKILPLILFIIIVFFLEKKIEIIDYFIYSLIGAFLYVFSQYYFFKTKPIALFETQEIKSIIKYSNYVWIGAIASTINNYIDSFMIMNFLGAEITGIYNFAYTFYIGLILITSLLVRFFIAETLNTNIRLKDVHSYSLKMFILSFIVFGLAYFIYPLIIDLFFVKYTRSIDIFHILSLSFIFVSVASVYGNILISKGKSKYYALAMLITALSNIIFNYIFIPIYGAIAAALGTLLTTVIAIALTYYYFRMKIIGQ